MSIVQFPSARKQTLSFGREEEPVRTAVARDAADHPSAFKLCRERNEIGFLDSHRCAGAGRHDSGIRIDEREHRKLRRPQIDLRQRPDEMLKCRDLRAAQSVSDVRGKVTASTGIAGRRRSIAVRCATQT
jgi:hypothetical protein